MSVARNKKKRKPARVESPQGRLSRIYHQLESVVVHFADFTTCRGFCDAFIEEKIAEGSQRVRASCITSIMATYARPFVKTRNPDYVPMDIKSRMYRFENERHQHLHEEILDLRHSFLAHSSRDVRQPDSQEGIYTVYNKIISADRVATVREMSDLLATKLEARRLELHREFFGATTPMPVRVGHSEAGEPVKLSGFGETVSLGMTLPSRP